MPVVDVGLGLRGRLGVTLSSDRFDNSLLIIVIVAYYSITKGRVAFIFH